MKKFYLIIPLLLLTIFASYYHGYRKEADSAALATAQQQAQIERREAQERNEYQAKVAKEAREVALAKARAEEEKQARIQAEELAWEQLNKDLETVSRKRDDAAQQSFDLSTTLRDEEDLLNRANDRLSILKDEKSFLDTYIPLSKANRDRLEAFLQKVDDAKKAAETAAAAAKTKR